MPQRRFGRVAVERHAPAGKAGRVDPPEQQIGIGHGRPGPAAAIAGRPRIGASAVRPDGDPLQTVDPRDRAAAGADLDHLDDRDAQWQPAALLEAVDPRDLKGAVGLRLQIVDQADLRGGPAHVIGQNFVEAALAGDLGGEDGAARRPRLDEPHRKADRGLDRGQPAARQHQEQRAGKPLMTQQGFEIGEVAADQWLDIGVGAGGRKALVFAHLGRHVARQGDRDPGQAIGQNLANAAFMSRVGKAVQKADRDRLDPLGHQTAGERRHPAPRRAAPIPGRRHRSARAPESAAGVAPRAAADRC